MKVSLLKKDKIFELILPHKISGDYWIQDEDFNHKLRNLINIEAVNGKWIIKSNEDVQIIYNKQIITSTFLFEGFECEINILMDKSRVVLRCESVCDLTFSNYEISSNCEITIGNDSKCDIIYSSQRISSCGIKLIYNNNWMIKNENPSIPVYVNGISVTEKKLYSNDYIYIYGLKIVVLDKILLINNYSNLVTVNNNIFKPLSIPMFKVENEENTIKKNIFVRPPRFRTVIEEKVIKIDNPPPKESEDDRPYILVVGPMLTMSMISLVTIYTSISGVLNKQQTLSQATPSLIMGVAMFTTMLVWPIINKKFEKKLREKREKKRQEKYSSYLESKKNEILMEISKQRQILLENNLALPNCQIIIFNKQRNLWERLITHDDFLTLRIGIGNVSPHIKVEYAEENFELEEDNLKNKLYNIIHETSIIENVPISFSLIKKNITAVVGNWNLSNNFLHGLLLQMLTFHGYDDLKIVILTNNNNKKKWDAYKSCPHIWDDSKQIRFFATNTDEINKVSTYLSQIIDERIEKVRDKNNESITDRINIYKNFYPYFVIVTDDYEFVKNTAIIKKILSCSANLGFSLIIQNERLINLPKECNCFISIDTKQSGLFENELTSNKQKVFNADFLGEESIESCFSKLSNISIELSSSRKELPSKVDFLGMYKVGKISQLNILNRWKSNNPIVSLQAPIGIDVNGELFKLDLHEKIHGPHGLIAGMTGSGKSEFIISYVLSMAINYHPYEVQFVLIDYKGGGLAGAFENKEINLKLPHLAGTITNLDENEMNRSLSSIQSELRRRQRIFNDARDKLKEGTIDIYKYQRFYREGKVSIPVSHLFIISDEFAELKAQQPEFMQQLISTARIGRSLGVHLILATQKPAGVVDDQIWSNSRFRVCLKVQEKADSMDMIKCEDAAALKQVGRFYLQVGYNELFELGQSAYSGAPYFPTDNIEKAADKSIYFVDNTGGIIKQIDENKKNLVVQGEQLPNIVEYLSKLAIEENISVNKLWLDKIKENIYLGVLYKKYNYVRDQFNLNAVIGEYDDPNNQKQDLLTLPLSKNGNIIIYGMAGSGKENLISTIIYSCITAYSVDEVNFYILDFGAGTLNAYKKAPHVGDIVTLNEVEKIENLFKMLIEEIEHRKSIFEEYNGNYDFYNRNSQTKIPRIVIIMNNYEAFGETYDDKEEYMDYMMKLTRDGFKYGIIFILTVSSATGSIRFKLLQNFSVKIPLQLSDKTDYSVITNSSKKIYPSKIFGRGLIVLNDVYEFQTAQIFPKEEAYEKIKETCNLLCNKYSAKAKSIPVLPDVLTIDYFGSNYSMQSYPVGIEKSTLKPVLYNFMNQYGNIICSEDLENMREFIEEFIKGLKKLSNVKLHIIDASSLFNFEGSITSDFKNDFEKYRQELSDDYDNGRLNGITVIDIVIGVHNYLQELDDLKDLYSSFLSDVGKAKIGTFILFDSASSMQKHEYDGWFQNIIDPSNGIWLGDGYDNQTIIKNQVYSREYSKVIGNKFGYIVKRGRPKLVRMLDNEGDING